MCFIHQRHHIHTNTHTSKKEIETFRTKLNLMKQIAHKGNFQSQDSKKIGPE